MERLVEVEQISFEDEVNENLLRPSMWDDYIGQEKIKKNLQVFIKASLKRNEALDHILLFGPPGLGKTTLAYIIAKRMNANIKVTAAPMIEKSGDLAAILTNLEEGDLLFIDEIHRLSPAIEEILYPAMEDFRLDIIIGSGPAAQTVQIDLPKFTLIGATTQMSKLSSPLRDRFGHVEKLRFYENDEIQQILEQSANILDVKLEKNAAELLAGSCRRTPRIANRILRRMRDFAEILHDGVITEDVIQSSLKSLSIDKFGLDYADQQYLRIIAENFAGGPVGLSTLSAALGEDESTIEEVIVSFLIREGFIAKTPRGRQLTQKAYTHLNLINPNNPELF